MLRPELETPPTEEVTKGRKLRDLFRREPKTSGSGIRVDGHGDVLVRFGQCCSPLPGDEIIGFVTRGRGVTIHARECRVAFELDKERCIDVEWEEASDIKRRIRIKVTSRDSPGLLAKVTKTISAAGINIGSARIDTHDDTTATQTFDLWVGDVTTTASDDEGYPEGKGCSRRRAGALVNDVRPKLSVCIIACNEERDLPRCLASVAFADEIVVVVDDRSRDATEKLATEAGAKTILRAYDGNIEQKNFALDQVRGEWVLSLDADEALSDPLAAELKAFLAGGASGAAGMEINRVTLAPGPLDPARRVLSGLAAPGLPKWSRPLGRHESAWSDRTHGWVGSQGRLTGEAYHWSYRDLADQVDRIQDFSSIQARANPGARPPPCPPRHDPSAADTLPARLRSQAGFPRRSAWLHHRRRDGVSRLPEVRQAMGTRPSRGW